MRILTPLVAPGALAASLLAIAPRADAQAYLAAPPPPAVFVLHGQRYCFAPDGWHGPGWYWCGDAHRPGLGWGGPAGWHGWSAPWVRGGIGWPHGGWHRHGGPFHGWGPHGRHPGHPGGHPHHHGRPHHR